MYPPALLDPRGGHNKLPFNENFFRVWSPQMAYVLGYIFADGDIEDIQQSSRTCSISITSKDVSILEEIKKVMDSSHKLEKIPPKTLFFPGNRKYTTKRTFRLRIRSKLLYNDLLELGVTPRKSLTITFPKIPPEFLSFFIRGYFDGDGCIHLKRQSYASIVFTSGSNKFLEGLSLTISQILNIPYKTLYSSHSRTTNPCYQLHYNGRYSRRLLKFMYNNLEKSPYLERKFLIYQRYLSFSL